MLLVLVARRSAFGVGVGSTISVSSVIFSSAQCGSSCPSVVYNPVVTFADSTNDLIYVSKTFTYSEPPSPSPSPPLLLPSPQPPSPAAVVSLWCRSVPECCRPP